MNSAEREPDSFLKKILHSEWLAYVLILFFSYLAINKSVATKCCLGFDNVDASSYLYYGLNLLKNQPPIGSYPSIPFQLISAIFSGGAFGLIPQIVYVAYLSCFIFAITNFFIYKIARLFFSKFASLFIIFFLLACPLFKIYISTSIRSLTDTWLMMFSIISAYYIILDKPFISPIFAGLGCLFRSQAFQFALLTPLAYKNVKKYLIHSSIFLLIYFLGNFILNSIFAIHKNSDFSFYSSALIIKPDLILEGLSLAFKKFIKFPILIFMIIIMILNFRFIVSEKRKSLTWKINLISLTTMLPNLILGYFYMTIVLMAPLTVLLRYIVYGLPLALITICTNIKYYLEKNNPQLLNRISSPKITYTVFALSVFCFSFNNIIPFKEGYTKHFVNFNPNDVPISNKDNIITFPSIKRLFVPIYHGLSAKYVNNLGEIYRDENFNVLYIIKRWGDDENNPEIDLLIAKETFSINNRSIFKKIYQFNDVNLSIHVYRKY